MQFQQNQTINIFLDGVMLILIILATYALIATQTQYKIMITLLMLAYLFYFIKFRINAYFPNQNFVGSQKVHQIPVANNRTMAYANNNNVLNQSDFIQQYKRLSYQKNQRIQLSQSLDKSASFIYMNRSKKGNDGINQSMSALSQKNKSTFLTDFNFIKNKQMTTSDSFSRKKSHMHDSVLRGYHSHQTAQEEVSKQLQKLRQDCSSRYLKTLNTLKLSERQSSKICDRIKKLCLQIVQEIYNQNIQNIKQIIQAIEQLYEIKINSRQLPDIQNTYNIKKHRNWKIEVNIQQLLVKLMKSKNGILDYPYRKLNEEEIRKNILFNRTEDIEQNNLLMKRKLQNSLQQRNKLNSLFYTYQNSNITPSKLIQQLNLLNQHIRNSQTQQAQFQLYNPLKISQSQSQIALLIFNLARSKINNIISQYKYTLQYSKVLLMGWFKNQSHQYQIKQTINRDYGHPHYDLVVGSTSGKKQEYYCQFGVRNGYSVLMMFFQALTAREIWFVRKNKVLAEMISKCLGINII